VAILLFQRFFRLLRDPHAPGLPGSKQRSDVTPPLGSILAKLVIKFPFVPGSELFMRPLDGYYDTRALGR
jgi:hypothetical protein